MVGPCMAGDEHSGPMDRATARAARSSIRRVTACRRPRTSRAREPMTAAARRSCSSISITWPDQASTGAALSPTWPSSMSGAVGTSATCSRSGPLPARRAQPPGIRGPRQRVHPPGRDVPRSGAGTLGARDDRLPELLRRGCLRRSPAMPRFDAVVTLTTPPTTGFVGTSPRWLQALEARLLEHGPALPSEPSHWAGWRIGNPAGWGGWTG